MKLQIIVSVIAILCAACTTSVTTTTMPDGSIVTTKVQSVDPVAAQAIASAVTSTVTNIAVDQASSK